MQCIATQSFVCLALTAAAATAQAPTLRFQTHEQIVWQAHFRVSPLLYVGTEVDPTPSLLDTGPFILGARNLGASGGGCKPEWLMVIDDYATMEPVHPFWASLRGTKGGIAMLRALPEAITFSINDNGGIDRVAIQGLSLPPSQLNPLINGDAGLGTNTSLLGYAPFHLDARAELTIQNVAASVTTSAFGHIEPRVINTVDGSVALWRDVDNDGRVSLPDQKLLESALPRLESNMLAALSPRRIVVDPGHYVCTVNYSRDYRFSAGDPTTLGTLPAQTASLFHSGRWDGFVMNGGTFSGAVTVAAAP